MARRHPQGSRRANRLGRPVGGFGTGRGTNVSIEFTPLDFLRARPEEQPDMVLVHEICHATRYLAGIVSNQPMRALGFLTREEVALEILEQTIVLMTEVLGPEHFLSLDTSGTLGRNYLLLGRISEALPLLERAYRERNDFRMKTRHGTHLFHAYDRSGKTDQAVALTRELSASMFEQLSVASTRLMVAEQMAKFSRYLLEADVFEDAIPLLRESLTIKQAALPNKWQTFDTQSTLGEALLGQRKYAQAEPLLLDGYQGLLEHQEEIPPHRKERLTESLPRLVRLYESWDASEPEAGYDKKAAEWKQKLDEFQQAR